MVIYSINDLEKISGVKAHTLRIWEKRYNIVQPKRTETNIRYYLDDDLKHVLNIALLNKNGIKISKIAQMKSEEIKRRVAEISEVDFKFENQLDSLTLSLLELDEFKFNKIVESNIHQIGFEKTMMEVIYPLLDKLSMMWITGSIKSAHERFVRNYIRQKTIASIDKLSIPQNEGSSFIIYLPENEDHELSLLFSQFLIKSRGHSVLNLGLHVALEDVKQAVEIIAPNFVYTIINDSKPKAHFDNYIKDLRSIGKGNTKILVSGIQVNKHNMSNENDIEIVTSFSNLIQLLERKKQLVA